jgi:tRNA(His) 5'-end guanylyltransferase
MRREGFAEHLEHFEVLGDRELMPGCSSITRLLLRDPASLFASRVCNFIQPYDARFGKMMVKTASYLLMSGSGAAFAFSEAEEISALVLGSEENARDAREVLLRMAAEASAKLSLLCGVVATFDARLYEFPNPQLCVEYFRWRQEQARTRALDLYCAYVLAKSGNPSGDTIKVLEGMAEDEKVEILRRSEIDFEGLPSWQRRGSGVYVRPQNGSAKTEARLVVDPNLPAADEYSDYLRRFFAPAP